MATATFNQPIYSGKNLGDEPLTYALNSVITTDLKRPYTYEFDTSPQGVDIVISPKDGSYLLVIQPLVEGTLIISLNNREDIVPAETTIRVMPDKIYSNEIKKLINNINFESGLAGSKESWSTIIGSKP